MNSTQGQRAAVGHGVNGIRSQRYDSLLQLAHVARNHWQILFSLDLDPDLVAALLMSDQPGSALNELIHIDGRTLPGTQPAEIEQTVGDGLTAKSLFAD